MRSLVFTLSLLAFLSQTRATDYEGDLINPALGEVTLSYVVPVSIKIVNVSQNTVNLAASSEAERSVTCSLQSNAPCATLKITSRHNFVLKNIIAANVESNNGQPHGQEDSLEYEVFATVNGREMNRTDSELVANVPAQKYGDQNVRLIFKLKDGQTERDDIVGGEYRDVINIKLEAQSEDPETASLASNESPSD